MCGELVEGHRNNYRVMREILRPARDLTSTPYVVSTADLNLSPTPFGFRLTPLRMTKVTS